MPDTAPSVTSMGLAVRSPSPAARFSCLVVNQPQYNDDDSLLNRIPRVLSRSGGDYLPWFTRYLTNFTFNTKQAHLICKLLSECPLELEIYAEGHVGGTIS